ncbi:uncharacterized protein SCHCODRAFT_01298231 [Schizophyllum commune H4-8]|uniref:uncharacterized protein n=1 Tax=Schizophyllum commune (strain H4-8 / FGSC 9210) TaxID=578458 RepID=UPI00215E4979|nr:uncharacterized protein SCHCODRAFT_01298231 [Schizophyllum commune H4-8]KAI5892007.1 hypothetical protein SCHCODRAFT_01298231 [Schizophyllum commune H4-8]
MHSYLDHPSGTDHPQFREKRRRLPCANIELPISNHRRRLQFYVKFEIGSTSHEYRWNQESHLSFEVPSEAAPHVRAKISLCAKNEKEDLRLASKECVLASLVLSELTSSIQLDICDVRLTEVPIVKVDVTVHPLEKATLEIVDALEKALTLPAKWDAMGRYVKVAVQIGGAIAEINPIAKAVFKLLDIGVGELERRKDNMNDIVSLVHDVGEASAVVIAVDSQGFDGKRARQIRARDALVPIVFHALSYIQSLKRGVILARLYS